MYPKRGTLLKVTRPSFFGGVPSYFEFLWYPHLYFQKAHDMCECKQAKRRKCLRRKCLHAIVLYKVKSMPEKSSASSVLDPTFTILKTMHQTSTIPNSAGMKELKAMNILKKQCRDNFQFGGKDKLNLKVFLAHLKDDRFFQKFGSFTSRD